MSDQIGIRLRAIENRLTDLELGRPENGGTFTRQSGVYALRMTCDESRGFSVSVNADCSGHCIALPFVDARALHEWLGRRLQELRPRYLP